MTAGRVQAVCVTHALVPDRQGDLDFTGIDKRPVDGPVAVGRLGLPGDVQYDTRNHGGWQQAVYAYAQEDRDAWAAELGRELPPGAFGENLSLLGVDVTGARIGELWRIGGAVLRVQGPRIPCLTFQGILDEPQWVKRFTQAGNPGAYLSVETEGELRGGNAVEIERPGHDVTIGDLFAVLTGDRERLARVAACPDIVGKGRDKLDRIMASEVGD